MVMVEVCISRSSCQQLANLSTCQQSSWLTDSEVDSLMSQTLMARSADDRLRPLRSSTTTPRSHHASAINNSASWLWQLISLSASGPVGKLSSQWDTFAVGELAHRRVGMASRPWTNVLWTATCQELALMKGHMSVRAMKGQRSQPWGHCSYTTEFLHAVSCTEVADKQPHELQSWYNATQW